MRPLYLLALLVLAAPATTAACPRCDQEGLQRSLVEGSFLHFHRITRTLRVRVSDEEDAWEDRIVVVGGVRPRRGDETLAWGDLERGVSLELQVHETAEDRYVVGVKVLGDP